MISTENNYYDVLVSLMNNLNPSKIQDLCGFLTSALKVRRMMLEL